MDTETDRQRLRRQLLGWNIACETIDRAVGRDPLGRDLRIAGGPGGRDLAVVREVENLGQALELALTTRLGDDPFDTTFGFDGLSAVADEVDPVIAKERVRIAVIQTIRRDWRVRNIVDIQVGPADTEATPTRTLVIRVVFEIAGGEQLSLGITGVVAGV